MGCGLPRALAGSPEDPGQFVVAETPNRRYSPVRGADLRPLFRTAVEDGGPADVRELKAAGLAAFPPGA